LVSITEYNEHNTCPSCYRNKSSTSPVLPACSWQESLQTALTNIVFYKISKQDLTHNFRVCAKTLLIPPLEGDQGGGSCKYIIILMVPFFIFIVTNNSHTASLVMGEKKKNKYYTVLTVCFLSQSFQINSSLFPNS